MKTFSRLILLLSMAFLMSACGADENPSYPKSKSVGGIEPINVDGVQYYFAYSFDGDEVLSPLLLGEDAAARFAQENLRQTDGSDGIDYWLSHIELTLDDPSLAGEPDAQRVPLREIKAQIESLRIDPVTPRALPLLNPEGYLWYLLASANTELPESGAPEDVELVAKKMDLPLDDYGTWHYESAAILSGVAPLPESLSFQDVATLYLWCHNLIIKRQRFGWSESLGLVPA